MDEGHTQEVGSQWNWGFGWMWRSLGRFTELDVLGNQLRASAQQPEGSKHPWLCLGRLRSEEKEGKGSKWKETISFWDAAPGSLFKPVLLSPGKLSVLGGNSTGKHLHKLWDWALQDTHSKMMKKTLQNLEAISIPSNPQAFETGFQVLTLEFQVLEYFGILSRTETNSHLDGIIHEACFSHGKRSSK